MGEIREWWHSHKPTTRRLAQLYCALLYNANIKGFISGELYQGKTKALCVPGFNCYSCPGAVGACPLGSLQNALASSGHTAPWYVFGILCLFGITLGRTICGWLCPLGLIQELLHKIPTPKLRKGRVTRALSWMKYVILAVFALWIPLIYGVSNNLPLPAFCKYICPAGTFEGAIALLSNPNNGGMFAQLGILFTRKFVILMVIAAACIFCYRSFCRFLCPLGAIYGLFNRFALVGVRVDESRCTHCGACVRNCEMDVRKVSDHECISCGKCMQYCGSGAISIKCGKVTLKGPETGKNAEPQEVQNKRKKIGRMVWGVLIAVLVFAVIYFNFIDVPKAAATESAVTASSAQENPQTTAETGPGGTESAAAEAATEEETQAEEETVVAIESAAEEAATEEETQTADAASPSEKETQAEEETAVAIESAAEEAQAEAETAAGTESATAEAAEQDFSSTAPVGADVGNQLPDFTCTLLDGSEFHLADYRGKIVFINEWATWCTACIAELPFFEQLQETHPEIEVLAFHHTMELDPSADAFTKEKGWSDWKIHFARDTEELGLGNMIKATTALPQTLVLNKKGEIIYNEQRSVTYEMLEALLKQAEEAP